MINSFGTLSPILSSSSRNFRFAYHSCASFGELKPVQHIRDSTTIFPQRARQGKTRTEAPQLTLKFSKVRILPKLLIPNFFHLPLHPFFDLPLHATNVIFPVKVPVAGAEPILFLTFHFLALKDPRFPCVTGLSHHDPPRSSLGPRRRK